VVAVVGPTTGAGWMPDPQRARKQLEEALEKWGRFTVVSDPKNADFVLLVEERHSGSTTIGSVGTSGSYSGTQFGILADTLAAYPGGQMPDTSAPPLWMHIETGGYSWPAKRAVSRFRKDVEAADANPKVQPSVQNLKQRVDEKVAQLSHEDKLSNEQSLICAREIWSRIASDSHMLRRVSRGDCSDVERIFDLLRGSPAMGKTDQPY
jgi:hypothetical protein